VAINTSTGTPFYSNAALAVGTTTDRDFNISGALQAFEDFTVAVTTTGTPDSYSVQVEGSIDGVNFYLIGAPVTQDGIYAISTSGVYVRYIRANITEVSGGTTPTITMTWDAAA